MYIDFHNHIDFYKDEEIDSNDYPVKTTISEKDNIDEVKEAFYKVDKRDSSGIYATT